MRRWSRDLGAFVAKVEDGEHTSYLGPYTALPQAKAARTDDLGRHASHLKAWEKHGEANGWPAPGPAPVVTILKAFAWSEVKA